MMILAAIAIYTLGMSITGWLCVHHPQEKILGRLTAIGTLILIGVVGVFSSNNRIPEWQCCDAFLWAVALSIGLLRYVERDKKRRESSI